MQLAAKNVIVRRFADDFTLVGRDLIITPLDTAAEKLVVSSFMREWLKERIIEHLEKGGEFTCRSQKDEPKAIYKLATDAEIMELATQGKLDQASSSGGVKMPRRSGKIYRFIFPPAGRKRDALLEPLRGQGRLIIDFVIESGETEFTVTALETLLETNRARLKTKPERKLLELFRFHMSESYKKMGIVEVVEPAREEEEEEEEEAEAEEEA